MRASSRVQTYSSKVIDIAVKQIVDGAEQKRQQYAKSFCQKEKAEKLVTNFAHPQEVLAVLKAAEGNFEELYRFLSMDFGGKNRELQLKMLQSLPKRDWRDVELNQRWWTADKGTYWKGQEKQDRKLSN